LQGDLVSLKEDLKNAEALVECQKLIIVHLEDELAKSGENAKEWRKRTEVLYGMLVEEVQGTYVANHEVLAEIMASLHKMFGVHLKD
jgi:hypothetical protein